MWKKCEQRLLRLCHNGEGALNVNPGLTCSVRFLFFVLRCRSLAAVQRRRHSPRPPQSASVPQVRGCLVTTVIRACKSSMWTIGKFFHVPEEDEFCAIWLPLLHTDQWRTLLILTIYVNTNKKNAKAHSSRFILLWYQLIFCNDFEKTWKKGVFLLRFCILQSIADVFYNVFGN